MSQQRNNRPWTIKLLIACYISTFALLLVAIFSPRLSLANEPARVFFENLSDNQKVTSPIKVKMGVVGMKVAPAGTMDPGTGHHHIIVNGDFVESGQVILADNTHLHFGKGQSEEELNLEPGKYTLTLQFADGVHRSFGKEMSQSLHIEVIK